MADKDIDAVDAVVEEKEAKETVDVDLDEDSEDKKSEGENGDISKSANGKEENNEAEEEIACPVKRKSAGGDAPEGTPAEGVSPEKKAKLDEASADAESNGDAEVAA